MGRPKSIELKKIGPIYKYMWTFYI